MCHFQVEAVKSQYIIFHVLPLLAVMTLVVQVPQAKAVLTHSLEGTFALQLT